MSAIKNRLKVTEIFFSLQGESRNIGKPTVFIRLTGCPLRCRYCDTEYAFTGGEWMSFGEIFDRVKSYQTKHITVTGGEPLAQKPCLDFLSQLCDMDYQVSVETSGALSIADIDERVSRVMDFKTPGSGEVDKNLMSNVNLLTAKDEVKFVICNEDDYKWSKNLVTEYDLSNKCDVLFSPSYTELDATNLADWIVADQLPVRMQMQLHKALWGNIAGK